MPSRRKRKRERRLAAPGQTGAAARRGDRGNPPAPGGKGGTCGLWADASPSELRLLREAIRRGWPVPQERRGPIMEEVRGPLGDASTPARVALSIARVALAADRANLGLLAEAGKGRARRQLAVLGAGTSAAGTATS
jgi:hypothetical protein